MAGSKSGAVVWAIVGNTFLTVLKFVAFLFSGSGAMLAEAVHSAADTGNQALLYMGIRRSLRPADETYHYGYGGQRFLYALFSAIGIFVFGCGITVYHGIHSLLDPPELTLSWMIFAVLGISMLVEGAVLRKAVAEVNASRGQKSFREFVRTSTDTTLLAVLFEDAVATVGVLVATGGILLSWLTGSPVFDAMSSIAIGGLLGLLAVWLGMRNSVLILGPSIPSDVQGEVVTFLEGQPTVASVREVRSRILSADHFRIAAEVDYDGKALGRRRAGWAAERASGARSPDDWERFAADFGEHLLDDLGREVDRIEAELQQRFPSLRHVDLESD
jgi:zinc transporter 9